MSSSEVIVDTPKGGAISPKGSRCCRVLIIVAEYFEMLQKEQAGISYSKTEARQQTLPLLKNRSNGSVEIKNRNISAVLARMGQPYIRGYLPAYNYQKVLLEDVVLAHLRRKPGIEDVFKRFAEIVPIPRELHFESMVEKMPTKKWFCRNRN